MENVTKFLEGKLKLKVNKKKSKVDRVSKRKFLWFTIYKKRTGEYGIRVSDKAKKKCRDRIKELTRRNWSIEITLMIKKLNEFLRGWIGYYYPADAKSFIDRLLCLVKVRLRMCHRKQRRKVKKRFQELKKLGMNKRNARMNANTRKSYARTAMSPILTTTLTNQYFYKLGLREFNKFYNKLCNAQ